MKLVSEELDPLITHSRYIYASISQLLGHNPAYAQQFIKRRSLSKVDAEYRKTLACFFGVHEQILEVLPIRLRMEWSEWQLGVRSVGRFRSGGRE